MLGLLAGGVLLTLSVYAAEDIFIKLPIHWMWWPAIGGIAVGIGGLIYPNALGVGYDTIQLLRNVRIELDWILRLMVVKATSGPSLSVPAHRVACWRRFS